MNRRLTLWLPLLVAALDALWAWGALNVAPGANAASSVAMINAVVWIFLHFPAVMLGGLPFDSGIKPGASLPPAEMALIAALGVIETAALAWWLARRMEQKQKT